MLIPEFIEILGSEDIDPDEPKTLNPITNSVDVNVDWKKSFSGNNLLGNFVPAFSAKSIFFADADGNIKSIDPFPVIPVGAES